MMDLNKRKLIKNVGFGVAGASALNLVGCGSTQVLESVAENAGPTKAEWDANVERIRNRIKLPNIPNREFVLTDFGGKGDGQFDNTQAFKDAIAAAKKLGGGKVIVPAGHFMTGPIHLESKTELHISEGATVAFYAEPERYKPYVFTRWEGMELIGYSPLIYAFKKTDIAITGKGTLEGGGSNQDWWPWKGKWKKTAWPISDVENQKHTRDALGEMVEAGVPVEQRVFEENYLRPPFIQPYLCTNVLIEDVTVKNSPFWLLNPVLCTSVTIRGVHCDSYGPNSDGCDPESCKDVLIQNCIFDTGDDCIAIKSGRNADGRRVGVPCQNLIIEDCQMKAGHGGVVIGSEISGGVRNLFAQNCEMSSPDLDRGIRIKTNSVRGGLLENLYYRDIKIGHVKDAIVVNYYYEEGDGGKFQPELRNINIHNLEVNEANRAFNIRGFPHNHITGISLKNVNIKSVKEDSVLENVSNVKLENVMIAGKELKSI
ncbi:glycoside hydrolase family 28 protein [Catenovulum sp. 2E275]|uniref:glycoside hydrolase family 28 protein n=1 Tax=Catenovulum sp. 2E275 TaxID=2980497 RepID=UPI0021D15D51|nr:glycoside hydrolase family 28 protein [Catenovulum sp. 2E275]MCU4677096.1 glycoside hydrolase family 28 protein [Catenovulum sp. 2E275]